MHEKLLEVIDLFDCEYDLGDDDLNVFENEDFCSVAYFGDIYFWMEGDTLALSFYSGTHPVAAAEYIRTLYEGGIDQFDIFENIHVVTKDGEYVEMLFGDEADKRYELEKYGIDPDEKVDIECPEGHCFQMSFAEFEGGDRCPICEKAA
jgi:hypothetical protein